MESGTEVTREYTSCDTLRSQGSRMMRLPGSYKTSVPVRNNTIDHQTACVVDSKNPMCGTGPVRTSSSSVVHRVHQAVVGAQMKTVRSGEAALQRRNQANDRYTRAACNKLMDQVQSKQPQ